MSAAGHLPPLPCVDDNPDLFNAYVVAEDIDGHAHAMDTGSGTTTHNVIPDSGCSRHCFTDYNLFTRFTKWHPNIMVRVANGSKVATEAIGEVELPMVDESGVTHTILLQNCLYVPSFHTNLLSIKQLYRQNHIKTKFCGRDYFKLRDGTKLYFDATHDTRHVVAMQTAHGLPNDILHKRYGHCGEKRLRLAATRALHDARASPGEYVKQPCDSCERGGKDRKRPREYRPRKKSEPNTASAPSNKYKFFGECVSSDLIDFSKNVSVLQKHRYAVGFFDHATGIMHAEYIQSKSAELVLQAYKRYERKFKSHLQNELNPNKGHVVEWHTDNGGEFRSNSMDEYCDEIAVKRSWSVPYAHNTNAHVGA